MDIQPLYEAGDSSPLELDRFSTKVVIRMTATLSPESSFYGEEFLSLLRD